MKAWLTPVAVVLSLVAVGGMFVRGRAAGPGEAGKEKEAEKRTINTSGTATIRVKPDAARLFFSVTADAPTVKEVRAQTAANFKKVSGALLDLKIADLKMKTSDVTLEPVYSHQILDKQPRLIGYRSTHSFTVLVSNADVEKLSADAARVLDAGFENGVNMMQRIAFLKLDEKDLRRQALTKAVEEAMNNARAIGAGAQIVGIAPVALHGEPVYSWGGRAMQNVMVQSVGPVRGGDGDGSEMVAGDLEITCTVSVTCNY